MIKQYVFNFPTQIIFGIRVRNKSFFCNLLENLRLFCRLGKVRFSSRHCSRVNLETWERHLNLSRFTLFANWDFSDLHIKPQPNIKTPSLKHEGDLLIKFMLNAQKAIAEAADVNRLSHVFLKRSFHWLMNAWNVCMLKAVLKRGA